MKLKDLIGLCYGQIKVISSSNEKYEIHNFEYPSSLLEKKIMRIQSEDDELAVYLEKDKQ